MLPLLVGVAFMFLVGGVAGRLGYPRCTYVKGYMGAGDGHNLSETYLLER